MFDVKNLTLPDLYPAVFPADFKLPPELEAAAPPEARGKSRDSVRMLVSNVADDRIQVQPFLRIADHLQPGDLLVVNDSLTLPAALTVAGVEVHLSVRLDGYDRPAANAEAWITEPRQYVPRRGETVSGLGGTLTFRQPLSHRLWMTDVEVAGGVMAWLGRVGRPIRYSYVPQAWPVESYQTVFGNRPGSAEMPSAGRPFTPRVLAGLAQRGIGWTPITLHTGVSSMETHEPPTSEWYEVSPEAAARMVQTRRRGGRVIAVGTTVVRALESTVGGGEAVAGRGWTDLVVSGGHRLRTVDGLITGLHEPRATHLAMLSAFAPVPHLRRAYARALEQGLLWHEFGDVHLITP